MRGWRGLLIAVGTFAIVASSCFAAGNADCLECHGSREILRLTPEERLGMVIPVPGGRRERGAGGLSLFVDVQAFRASVHGELSCVDCHADAERLPHPQRMATPDCAQCHQEEVAQYATSKHAKVSERLCFECHNPHTTVSFRRLSGVERRGICLRCHREDVERGHRWLPQRALHFRYLECTTCHAPKAKKGIVLRFASVDQQGHEVALSYEQLRPFARQYGDDVAKAVDFNGDGRVEVYEVTRFLARLKRGGIGSACLKEEVLVLQPFHNFTDEVRHVKDCTMCHTSRAPFYSRVTLSVPRRAGGWRTLEVDRAILAKIPPIPSKDYYYSTIHGKSGVECIDCHADLRVLPKQGGFVISMKTPVCGRCHRRVMEEYKRSLHYKVSRRICFGCHDPHSAVTFSRLSAEQRRAICERCHPHVERKHDWLPQRALHFKYLECTMCHSPQAEKGMVFYLKATDATGRQRRLRYPEVARMLGTEAIDLASCLDKNGNGRLETREVLSFLKLLNARRGERWKRIELGVNVLVLRPSHNFTDRGTRAKDCAICHSSRAEFYSKLVLEIPEPGGAVRTMPVEREILVGIHPIPVTSDFYLLGESRISKKDIEEFLYVVRKIGYKWLDVIGLLFVLGAMGFVCLHGLIRALTVRLRIHRRGE